MTPLDKSHLDRMVYNGIELQCKYKEGKVNFLHNNVAMIAWASYNLLGVDQRVIKLHLNMNPSHKLVKQK